MENTKPTSEQWHQMMQLAQDNVFFGFRLPDEHAQHYYEHFQNCVPPIINRSDAVMCSEPFTDTPQGAAYSAVIRKNDKWYFMITTIEHFKLMLDCPKIVSKLPQGYMWFDINQKDCDTIHSPGICCRCNGDVIGADGQDGVFIAVLNEFACQSCFDDYASTAKFYPEDIKIEFRNLNSLLDQLINPHHYDFPKDGFEVISFDDIDELVDKIKKRRDETA